MTEHPRPGAPRTRRAVTSAPIRAQVLAVLGVMVMVTGVILTLGVLGLARTASAANDLYDRNVQGTQLAGEMKYQMVFARFNAASGGYVQDPDKAAEFRAARDAALTEIGIIAEQYIDQAAPTPEQAAVLESIRADVAAYAAAIIRTDELLAAGRSSERDELVASTVAPLGKKVAESIGEISSMQVADSLAAAEAVQAASARTRAVSLAAGAIGVALSVVLALRFAGSLAGRLGRVAATASSVAAGDLTTRSGVDQGDEVGQVGVALDSAVAHIRELVGGVEDAVAGVAASADSLAGAQAEVASSAGQTSAQAGVVAAAAG
ncbi:MAG TPA: methyl-accepting chemotaxis protein, partial [Actinotalea sp.]|nr:methyl-accepting chemotaxis protein [Actinotalea sp.]